MKIQIVNYTFNSSTKAITFTDYTTILLSSILLVVDATHNTIIYNFADPTKGGTVATNVLTLTGTGLPTMANSDSLLIYYDQPTEFAADTAYVAGNFGNQILAVRRDANTTLATVSGGYAPLQLDAAGSLKVNITAGAGSGGTSLADQAAFTSASTSFTPVGGLYQASADTLSDGHAAAIALDVNRNLKITLATLLGGEDLTNNLLGTMRKPVAASTYSPSIFTNLGVTMGTVTMTIATPGVMTFTAHGLSAGEIVFFTTTGALPTGLTANTHYYVIAGGLTANAFEVSATSGGAAINTSGSQSGTHTLKRLQITKLNLKASMGNLLSVVATNVNTALRFLQFHNSATTPAAGATPFLCFPLGAGSATVPSSLSLGNKELTDAGINFSTGIGVALSTTYDTFTDSALSADHTLLITYV